MKNMFTIHTLKITALILAVSIASPVLAETGTADAKPAAKNLDAPVKPLVEGKFIGNEKPAELKFVTVEGHERFSDKEAITLIFTEKDPAKSKKPSFDASFGKLGSALVINVHHDGGIFGCQVSHSAHSKRGFSSVGRIKTNGFTIAGGNVSGQITTGGVLEFFGDKWDVDLKFAAPLPDSLRNPSPAVEKPVEKPKAEEKAPKPVAGPLISASKLPLPADAADVDFKALVKQIHCTSKLPVDAVTKDLSARLKAQGWKVGKGNLQGKKNAILMWEQGDAKLTIFIQPSATGSTVKIMADGLDWSDSPKTPAKQPARDAGDDIEKKANDLIKDALKNIPQL